MAKTFDVTTSFTRVSLTFEADTVGAINNDNGHGIILYITLQAGSDRTSGSIRSTWETLSAGDTADSNQTQFFDSTSRTLFITGLQMEVGSVATPFEHRSFGEELLLCQRYYREFGGDSSSDALFAGVWFSATTVYCPVQLLPHMRAAPTVSRKTTNSDDFDIFGGGFSDQADEAVGSNIRHNNFRFYIIGPTSRTVGQGAWSQTTSGQAITCDAEL